MYDTVLSYATKKCARRLDVVTHAVQRCLMTQRKKSRPEAVLDDSLPENPVNCHARRHNVAKAHCRACQTTSSEGSPGHNAIVRVVKSRPMQCLTTVHHRAHNRVILDNYRELYDGTNGCLTTGSHRVLLDVGARRCCIVKGRPCRCQMADSRRIQSSAPGKPGSS